MKPRAQMKLVEKILENFWVIPKMLKINRRISSVLQVICGLGIGYLYYRVAPLQVDPHHDGVILAAAIGVSEGLPVHHGVFSQYGPLPPLLQGLILWIFNTQLLTLRLFTAFQCIAIGYCLFKLLRYFNQKSISKLFTLFWLAVSGIWVTEFPGSLLPWPSLLATLFVLSGLIALIESEKNHQRFLAFISGFLLACSGFCRIQSFILLPLVLLVILLKFPASFKKISYSIPGYLFAVLSMAIYLVFSGGLADYIQQGIITPFFAYTGMGQGNNYNRFQFSLYIIESVVFLFLLYFVFRIRKRFQSIYVVSFICLVLLILIKFLGHVISSSSLPIKFRVLLGEPFQNVAMSPYYFGAIAALLLIIVLVRHEKRFYKPLNFEQAVVAITGAGTAIQLYPQPDVMHLWWISPIFLSCLLILLEVIDLSSKKDYSAKAGLLASPLIIIGLVSAYNFIDRPWTEYRLSVLKGTYANYEKARSLDIFTEIESRAVLRKTSFDCPDGVYSVAAGKYLPPDQWFVNWGYDSKEIPNLGSLRVICDRSREFAESQEKLFDMNLVFFATNTQGKSIAILSRNELLK